MEKWDKGKKKKNYFLSPIMENLKKKILCFKFTEAFFLKNTKTIEFFLEFNSLKKKKMV